MVAKKTTETRLASLEPPLLPIAESLRQLILDADPELSESIKWGNPTFERGGKVCYLAATKAYVSLGFFNGAALTDPKQAMEIFQNLGTADQVSVTVERNGQPEVLILKTSQLQLDNSQ